MSDLEPLLALWRAKDQLFERVEPTWWGAVVSDARYPAIQEPNYARVEAREPVSLGEIEAELLRRSSAAGARGRTSSSSIPKSRRICSRRRAPGASDSRGTS